MIFFENCHENNHFKLQRKYYCTPNLKLEEAPLGCQSTHGSRQPLPSLPNGSARKAIDPNTKIATKKNLNPQQYLRIRRKKKGSS